MTKEELQKSIRENKEKEKMKIKLFIYKNEVFIKRMDFEKYTDFILLRIIKSYLTENETGATHKYLESEHYITILFKTVKKDFDEYKYYYIISKNYKEH